MPALFSAKLLAQFEINALVQQIQEIVLYHLWCTAVKNSFKNLKPSHYVLGSCLIAGALS